MKATRILHDLGQSLWLDNITRGLLRTGVLRRYIDEFSVTGLTSNPTIFDHAIKNSGDYDDAIKSKLAEGKSGEKLFFELALEDLTRGGGPVPAGPRPNLRRGRLGFARSLAFAGARHEIDHCRGQGATRAGAASQCHDQDSRHPRRSAGDRRGDLRGSADQRHAVVLRRSVSGRCQCVHARHRTAHRSRIEARYPSVASIFISRWDVAVAGKVPEALHDRLGIAIAKRTYKAYLDLVELAALDARL